MTDLSYPRWCNNKDFINQIIGYNYYFVSNNNAPQDIELIVTHLNAQKVLMHILCCSSEHADAKYTIFKDQLYN